jgi:hypothetical protein
MNQSSKKTGWDEDSEEMLLSGGRTQTIEKKKTLLEKREKLEALQATELAWGEGKFRQKDEWDHEYDQGKQKKVRKKVDGSVPFDT